MIKNRAGKICWNIMFQTRMSLLELPPAERTPYVIGALEECKKRGIITGKHFL
jgi:N-acetylmuramic acid 6-phosphate (MurNAc-6-P) etherase